MGEPRPAAKRIQDGLAIGRWGLLMLRALGTPKKELRRLAALKPVPESQQLLLPQPEPKKVKKKKAKPRRPRTTSAKQRFEERAVLGEKKKVPPPPLTFEQETERFFEKLSAFRIDPSSTDVSSRLATLSQRLQSKAEAGNLTNEKVCALISALMRSVDSVDASQRTDAMLEAIDVIVPVVNSLNQNTTASESALYAFFDFLAQHPNNLVVRSSLEQNIGDWTTRLSETLEARLVFDESERLMFRFMWGRLSTHERTSLSDRYVDFFAANPISLEFNSDMCAVGAARTNTEGVVSLESSYEFIVSYLTNEQLQRLAETAEDGWVQSETERLLLITTEIDDNLKSDEELFYEGLISFRSDPDSEEARQELTALRERFSSTEIRFHVLEAAVDALVESVNECSQHHLFSARQNASNVLFDILATAHESIAEELVAKLDASISDWVSHMPTMFGGSLEFDDAKKAMFEFMWSRLGEVRKFTLAVRYHDTLQPIKPEDDQQSDALSAHDFLSSRALSASQNVGLSFEAAHPGIRKQSALVAESQMRLLEETDNREHRRLVQLQARKRREHYIADLKSLRKSASTLASKLSHSTTSLNEVHACVVDVLQKTDPFTEGEDVTGLKNTLEKIMTAIHESRLPTLSRRKNAAYALFTILSMTAGKASVHLRENYESAIDSLNPEQSASDMLRTLRHKLVFTEQDKMMFSFIWTHLPEQRDAIVSDYHHRFLIAEEQTHLALYHFIGPRYFNLEQNLILARRAKSAAIRQEADRLVGGELVTLMHASKGEYMAAKQLQHRVYAKHPPPIPAQPFRKLKEPRAEGPRIRTKRKRPPMVAGAELVGEILPQPFKRLDGASQPPEAAKSKEPPRESPVPIIPTIPTESDQAPEEPFPRVADVDPEPSMAHVSLPVIPGVSSKSSIAEPSDVPTVPSIGGEEPKEKKPKEKQFDLDREEQPYEEIEIEAAPPPTPITEPAEESVEKEPEADERQTKQTPRSLVVIEKELEDKLRPTVTCSGCNSSVQPDLHCSDCGVDLPIPSDTSILPNYIQRLGEHALATEEEIFSLFCNLYAEARASSEANAEQAAFHKMTLIFNHANLTADKKPPLALCIVGLLEEVTPKNLHSVTPSTLTSLSNFAPVAVMQALMTDLTPDSVQGKANTFSFFINYMNPDQRKKAIDYLYAHIIDCDGSERDVQLYSKLKVLFSETRNRNLQRAAKSRTIQSAAQFKLGNRTLLCGIASEAKVTSAHLEVAHIRLVTYLERAKLSIEEAREKAKARAEAKEKHKKYAEQPTTQRKRITKQEVVVSANTLLNQENGRTILHLTNIMHRLARLPLEQRVQSDEYQQCIVLIQQLRRYEEEQLDVVWFSELGERPVPYSEAAEKVLKGVITLPQFLYS